MDTPAATRDRLITAMLDLLRQRGFHGVGLNEILSQAGAPKGVLYHHFPGGKSALAVAAIDAAVSQMLAGLERLLAAEPHFPSALGRWLDGAERQLEASGWARGCPLAAIALETTPADTELRAALDAAFTAIRGRLARALSAAGLSDAAAAAMAALLVAGYEGALLQARVAGSPDALRQTRAALIAALTAQLPAGGPS
jgi:TetR/AcrR family transcriptional repressor of lmrAB and yxaGH operons